MMKLSVGELAERTKISEKTIRRIESQFGVPNTTVDVFSRLYHFFSDQGFSYAPEVGDERGPGVYWGRYPGRQIQTSN